MTVATWGGVILSVDARRYPQQGDTAWVALNGRVEFSSNKRPISPNRDDGQNQRKWMFEQVVFSVDDRRAGLKESIASEKLRVAQ